MKRLTILASILAFSTICWGKQRFSGFCESGGQAVMTNASASSTKVQRSYPSCTVTVYLTGTLTPALLYSDDNGTVKSNPFTADTRGEWFFYSDVLAEDGSTSSALDVRMSGTGISTPFTRVLPNVVQKDGNGNVVIGATVTARNIPISVMDPAFGAKGDDSTDDTAALQAALNDPRPIYIPAGTYRACGLTIPNLKKVYGAGFKASRIKCLIPGADILKSASDGLLIDIRDIGIDGNGVAATGLTIGNSDTSQAFHVILQNIEVVSSASYQILLRSPGMLYANNIFVSGDTPSGTPADYGLKVVGLSQTSQINNSYIHGAKTNVYVEGGEGMGFYKLYTYAAAEQATGSYLVHVKNSQFNHFVDCLFEPLSAAFSDAVLIESTQDVYANSIENEFDLCRWVGPTVGVHNLTIGTVAGSGGKTVYKTVVRNSTMIQPAGGYYDVNIVNGADTLVERLRALVTYNTQAAMDPRINEAGSTRLYLIPYAGFSRDAVQSLNGKFTNNLSVGSAAAAQNYTFQVGGNPTWYAAGLKNKPLGIFTADGTGNPNGFIWDTGTATAGNRTLYFKASGSTISLETIDSDGNAATDTALQLQPRGGAPVLVGAPVDATAFKVSGTAGMDLSCGVDQVVTGATYKKGVLTAGTCTTITIP